MSKNCLRDNVMCFVFGFVLGYFVLLMLIVILGCD